MRVGVNVPFGNVSMNSGFVLKPAHGLGLPKDQNVINFDVLIKLAVITFHQNIQSFTIHIQCGR